MSFFDEDDPVEDMIKEFFGGQASRRVKSEDIISGENEERKIDFVETPNNFFVVFELLGYDKEDIQIKIKGNEISIFAHKKCSENTKDYIAKRLEHGIKIIKTIPKFIKTKKFDYSFKNGILEIQFRK